MNDDQLRDRIGRLDPVLHGDTAIQPVTSPAARALLEDIMNTPTQIEPPRSTEPTPPPRRPWWAVGAAAAAVVAVVAIGVTVMNRDDDAPEVATTVAPTAPAGTQPGDGTVLELDAGVEDLLASCMVLDPTVLAQAPIAFRGTVTLADAGVVQLTVDQAYRGVDAQAVTLLAPEGQDALVGGVAWEVGQQYLVTAYDGTVAYCGQTGPATPELQAIFDQAFATG